MKNLIKRLSALTLALCLVLCLAGCGESQNKTAKFYKGKVKGEKSGAIAQNDKFTLGWDADKAALLLTSRSTGRVWCTTPYDFYQNDTGEGLASVALSSPLNISYVEKSTLSVKTASGSTAVLKNGRIASKKIKNGIRVTYFFDNVEIAVPVDYILNERGLEARVQTNGIIEGEYPIYKISLHPYMISAPNNDSSYLIVPSGSGGVIYTKNGTPKDYAEYIYGDDPVKISWAKTAFEKQVRLPVFSAVNGESSIMAVVENGADAAMIEAHACDGEIGYSGAFVSFMLRGFDMTSFTDKAGQAKPVKKFSDGKISAKYLSVGYYPMEDYPPDYTGVAQMYRDILDESGALSDAAANAPKVALDVLGGAESGKLALGFPYRSLDTATTVTEAMEIARDVNTAVDGSLLIRLSGFGDSGLDAGELGGGFKMEKAFGTKKQLLSFQEYCKKKGNVLAFDFDLMRYSQKGGGFSTTGDSVKTPNLITRVFYSYDVATNEESGPKYFLLSPTRFTDASKKLSVAIDKMQLDAVSLNTMGNMTYSDYTYAKHHSKGGNVDIITKVLKTAKKGKTQLVTADANVYAAVLSDYVTDVPTESSQYDCIDMDIPLYSMVLRGSTNLYSSSINAANNPRIEFLRAMEIGAGLSFSVCADMPSALKASVHSDLSASRYSSVKSDIEKYAKEADEFLQTLGNSSISAHSKDGALSHTVFSNGAWVYVNFGDTPIVTPEGEISAHSFIYGKEVA